MYIHIYGVVCLMCMCIDMMCVCCVVVCVWLSLMGLFDVRCGCVLGW